MSISQDKYVGLVSGNLSVGLQKKTVGGRSIPFVIPAMPIIEESSDFSEEIFESEEPYFESSDESSCTESSDLFSEDSSYSSEEFGSEDFSSEDFSSEESSEASSDDADISSEETASSEEPDNPPVIGDDSSDEAESSEESDAPVVIDGESSDESSDDPQGGGGGGDPYVPGEDSEAPGDVEESSEDSDESSDINSEDSSEEIPESSDEFSGGESGDDISEESDDVPHEIPADSSEDDSECESDDPSGGGGVQPTIPEEDSETPGDGSESSEDPRSEDSDDSSSHEISADSSEDISESGEDDPQGGGGGGGGPTDYSDPSLSVHGLSLANQYRPFQIVDWDNLIMYLPEDSLIINGQKVFIQECPGSTRRLNNDFIKLLDVNNGGPFYNGFVPPVIAMVEVFTKWDMDVTSPGDSMDYWAWMTFDHAPSLVEKGMNLIHHFSAVQVPQTKSESNQVQRRQFVYGQVAINGLKQSCNYVAFELNVVFTIDYIDRSIQKDYLCYTPPNGSVQHNGVLMPIVEADGGDVVHIEPNKDYWCHVGDVEAHINDEPLEAGECGFYIGRIDDPNPWGRRLSIAEVNTLQEAFS